jgi:REP element-mobilizing transposase RayT
MLRLYRQGGIMITSGCSKYHRHSIRLAGYDYSQPGVYFITICTHGRCPLLGEAVECQIRLNEWGRVARVYWLEIHAHFSNVTLDEFVIMPDHVHGIIAIADTVAVGAPDVGIDPGDRAIV